MTRRRTPWGTEIRIIRAPEAFTDQGGGGKTHSGKLPQSRSQKYPLPRGGGGRKENWGPAQERKSFPKKKGYSKNRAGKVAGEEKNFPRGVDW